MKVYVDESGKVIWAKAIRGHRLLHEAAENAARQTRFQPTVVSGKHEKVVGILLYNFVP